MKKRQLAKLGLTLGLVAAVSVGGTLALLSAQSNIVTNTFAAGNGINAKQDLTLFEHNTVNPNDEGITETFNDGTPTGDEGKIDITGVDYENLEPNMTLQKDPKVQVSEKTANCYLFAKVENGMKDITGITIDGIFSTEGNANWKLVDGTTDLYYYTENGMEGYVVDTNDGAVITEPLFTTVTLASNADIYDTTTGTNKLTSDNNIEVKALAVQATKNNNWDEAVKIAKEFNWK